MTDMLTMSALVLAWGSCTPAREEGEMKSSVAAVLAQHSDSLMNIPGVVGTAEGSCAGRPCILVLVERLTPRIRKAVPSLLEGVPVEIQETGRIQAR
jgi:hypothetical protein